MRHVNRLHRIARMLPVTLLIAGCRTATRVAEVPRVDLELSGGNQGYFVGAPPAGSSMKTTRQMVQTDIEIPSFYKPTHVAAPVGVGTIVPPEMEQAAEPSAPAERYDTYVVQKGESLWSIAAKPEIYGKATRWRRIFDANRDLLKSPDRVRPGMTLHIPRGEQQVESGTTYGK